MNECTIESFINFCDDMQIANEGLFENIKNLILHKSKHRKTSQSTKAASKTYYIVSNSQLGDTINKELYTEPDLLISLYYTLLAQNIPVYYYNKDKKLFLDSSNKSILNKTVYVYTVQSTSSKISAGSHTNNLFNGKLSDLISSHNINLEYVNYNSTKSIFDSEMSKAKKAFKNIKGVSFDLDTNNYDESDIINFIMAKACGEKDCDDLTIADCDLFKMNGDCPDDKIDEGNDWLNKINALCSKLTKESKYFKFDLDGDKFEGYVYILWK